MSNARNLARLLPDSSGQLATANIANAAVTAPKLANNASSFSGSGYQKLPSGLIVQWGGTPFSGGGGTANITFPVAFPTACLAVTASVGRGTTLGGYMMSTQIGTFNTTSASVIGNYDTGGTAGINPLSVNEYAAWIAFGY